MTSFRNYWGRYLHAHSRPATRSVHYFATVLGLSGFVSSIIWLDPWPAVIAIVAAYAVAIGAHWFIERNQPLILANPFWGAVSDMRMCLLALAGKLEGELQRHNVARPGARDHAAQNAVDTKPLAAATGRAHLESRPAAR